MAVTGSEVVPFTAVCRVPKYRAEDGGRRTLLRSLRLEINSYKRSSISSGIESV